MYIDTSTASFLYFFLYFCAAFTCGAAANQSFLSERNEMCPPNLYIWISCWCLVTHTQSYWIWWLKTLLGLNVFSFFFPFPCRFSLPVASDSLPWLFPLAFSQTPAPPTGPCKHSTHTHANRSTFNLSVHYTVAVDIFFSCRIHCSSIVCFDSTSESLQLDLYGCMINLYRFSVCWGRRP